MSKIRKALTAAVLAGAAAAIAALTKGSLTAADWGTIAGAAVAAGLAVWRIPNAPATDTPQSGIHR